MSIEDQLYRFLPVYSSLPYPIKAVAARLYRLLPARVRFGKHYARFQDNLRFERAASKEDLLGYQLEQLRKLVKHAVSSVPWYQSAYSSANSDIRSIEEFRQLPLISKREIRGRTEQLVSSHFPLSQLNRVATGGSTGEPLLLFKERGVARTKEQAYMLDQWSRIGYRFGDSVAMLRGALVRGRGASRLWEYEPVKNRWIYSTFDLTPENMKKILEHMRKRRPRWLHVYPSALTLLASFMKERNEPPIPSVKGILSGSENTFPAQIRLFEQVFRCPVFRWYGMGEMAALAGGCEHSHVYHAYNTYSFVELLDEQGHPVTRIGGRGEIVGTAFDNLAMPLIRYRTGDFAFYAGDRCARCGRTGVMLSEIEGREQEVVLDFHGNRFSLAPFIFGVHENLWSRISAIQFEQHEPGRLVLRAVSTVLPDSEVIDYLDSVFGKRFAGNFELRIVPVRKIERTPAGKHMYLLQHLDVGSLPADTASG